MAVIQTSNKNAVCYIQCERWCCIGYTSINRRLLVKCPIQHRREYCKVLVIDERSSSSNLRRTISELQTGIEHATF